MVDLLAFTLPEELVVERPGYRYLVTDLRTGARLGELPLSGVEYGEELNRAGTLSAAVDLAENAQGTLDATIPRRTALWVYRGGTIVWAGIIWGRQANGRSLSLQCGSMWSYFGRRILTAAKSYTAVDQLSVAQDLVQWAQDQPGGDINVIVVSETSGVPITREPLAWGYELKSIGELVESLAEVDDGFDFAVTAAEEADVPVARFASWYPRRGRSAVASQVVFTHRKNLIDYSVNEDGLSAATTVYGVGAGDGEDQVLVVSVRTSMLDDGFPLQETTIARKDETSAEVLVQFTEAEVRARSDTPMTWEMQVDPDDISTPFGAWTIGDDARIVIDDDWRFPAGINGEPGFDGQIRIIGQKVTVPDDGGPDIVTLVASEAYGA